MPPTTSHRLGHHGRRLPGGHDLRLHLPAVRLGGVADLGRHGRDLHRSLLDEDSSICVAAVHAGLITAEEGGTVQVERTAGQETYGDGFEANGVTSQPWTVPWSGSFVFTKDTARLS